MDDTSGSITGFVQSLANAYLTVQTAKATVPVANAPASSYVDSNPNGAGITSYLANPLVIGLGVVLVGLFAWRAIAKKG